MALRAAGLPLPLPASLGGTGSSNGAAVTQLAQYTTATVTPTAEATILGTVRGSKTLAAGAMNTLGQTLQIDGGGQYSTTTLTPGNLTARIYVGAAAISTTTITSLLVGATNAAFDYTATIVTIATGVSGQVRVQGRLNYDTGTNNRQFVNFIGTATLDLTVAQNINITAQWASAGAGTGTNTLTNNTTTVALL